MNPGKCQDVYGWPDQITFTWTYAVYDFVNFTVKMEGPITTTLTFSEGLHGVSGLDGWASGCMGYPGSSGLYTYIAFQFVCGSGTCSLAAQWYESGDCTTDPYGPVSEVCTTISTDPEVYFLKIGGAGYIEGYFTP